MSLNYDLSKIADHKKLCFTKVKGGFKIHPLTEALIFSTMFADMGKITEKNAREFATRLRAYEPVEYTVEDVHAETLALMANDNLNDLTIADIRGRLEEKFGGLLVDAARRSIMEGQ
jgi:hypothetical protein